MEVWQLVVGVQESWIVLHEARVVHGEIAGPELGGLWWWRRRMVVSMVGRVVMGMMAGQVVS